MKNLCILQQFCNHRIYQKPIIQYKTLKMVFTDLLFVAQQQEIMRKNIKPIYSTKY